MLNLLILAAYVEENMKCENSTQDKNIDMEVMQGQFAYTSKFDQETSPCWNWIHILLPTARRSDQYSFFLLIYLVLVDQVFT